VSASNMSLRLFVLGLLNLRPMSGYDIKRSLRSLSWLIGSPSPGSLYPALRSLLRDGLVTVRVVVRQDKPPRKEYHVTKAGENVVQEWMSQPARPGTVRTFAMRLILASNLAPAALRVHLEKRRSEVSRCHDALELSISALGEGADFGQRLALDYGLAVARSELAWLDSVLQQSPHHQAAKDITGAAERHIPDTGPKVRPNKEHSAKQPAS
jgi:PadR family transcriptional regulator AphA